MRDDLAFAWAAGLFEGEGSIVYGPRDGGVRRRLTLGMTDEDVIGRFYETVGVGHLNGPYERFSNGKPVKPMYNWAVNSWDDLEPLLRRMLPFLGARRGDKARMLLADPSPRPGRPPRIEAP